MIAMEAVKEREHFQRITCKVVFWAVFFMKNQRMKNPPKFPKGGVVECLSGS